MIALSRNYMNGVKSPSLLRHSYLVERVMHHAAMRYGEGAEDVERWGITGLLHDADYELYPEEHPKRIVDWLECQREYEIAYAISCHYTAWNVPYKTRLDRALVSCDEISGFVVACCLLRPDGILSLNAASVLKKLREKTFAASVDRGEIVAGVKLLNVDLNDHVSFIINALRTHAAEFGLDGTTERHR